MLAAPKYPMKNVNKPLVSPRHVSTAVSLAVALACISFSSGVANATTPQLEEQIKAIVAMKSTFTPTEKKMSSNLVFRSRLAAGQSVGAATSAIDRATASATTMVKVDIGGKLSPAVRALIEGNGGTVTGSSDKYNRIAATMPLKAIALVAAHSDVNWIRQNFGAVHNVGALTTQGYISQGANTTGTVKGNGIKVGVLSDSASAAEVSALIASGDLAPNTTVIAGQSGEPGTDEGCAMMEIVQDMAPKAQLFFATADPDEPNFINNISLLAAAGCKIIVDDVTYFDEGAFQDGPVAQEVTSFVNGGGLYFSSAANSGNLTSGTSGTWEGDFVNGGNIGAPITTTPGGDGSGKYHNFASGQHYDAISFTQPGAIISLKWSDPLGASSNDYDLFITDSGETTVLAFSNGVQDGTEDPFEILQYDATAGDHIIVVKFNGASRALRVDTNRNALSIGTDGSTFGHNAGTSTIGCAAVYWNSKKQGSVPFSSLDKVETFSSDGPRKLFYLPNGTAITAGNFLFGTNGGTTLQQPLLSGTNGADSRVPGFMPFFGTSSAAPHCAGVAALVESANPSLPNFQVRNILLNSTIDIMASGVDRDTGYGILMAQPAVNNALGQ
jgi:hypothetical protein